MHSCMYVRMCLRSYYRPGFLYKSIMAVKKAISIEGIDFGPTSVLITINFSVTEFSVG